MTNTEVNTKENNTKKLSSKAKFAICVAIFIVVGMILNLLFGKFAPATGVKMFSPADILVDGSIGALVGWLVFLRKKKDKTAANA